MKVYIEFTQDQHMVRKIIHNVEMVIKKPRSYTYVYEKVDNELVEHMYSNDCIFDMHIDD